MYDSSIHTAGDGRRARNVFVNGNLITHCVFADTKRGVVVFIPQPSRIDRTHRDVYKRKLKGVVTVEYVNG